MRITGCNRIYFIYKETMKYISSLEKVNRESENPVNFLGPISLFIRLKVRDVHFCQQRK